MLSQRIQRILRTAQHASLARLLVAGNNVRPNLILESQVKEFSTIPNLRCQSNKTASDRHETIKCVKSWRHIILRSLSTEAVSLFKDDDVANELTKGYEREQFYEIIKLRGNLQSFVTHLQPSVRLSDEELESMSSVDWKNFTVDEILDMFEKLFCTYAALDMKALDLEKYSGLIEEIKLSLPKMSFKNIQKIFQCLMLSTLYKGLWKDKYLMKLRINLNQELIDRMKTLSKDEILLTCDYWCHLPYIHKNSSMTVALNFLGDKPKNLNIPQLLQLLYLISRYRKPNVNMYELEYRVSCIMDSLSINEQAIMAAAFFKSQTPIRDKAIIAKMHDKLVEDVDNAKDACISSIMKITRYSTSLQHMNSYRQALRVLGGKLHELTLPCIVNILHAAAYVQIYEEELMTASIKRIMENIHETRLKDMERFLWSLSIFNYSSDPIMFEKCLPALRDPNREIEFQNYPKVLPLILTHLSYVNIYPEDLIKRVFDPTFLEKTYPNMAYKIDRFFLVLETNIKIDVPKYDGPFLKPAIYEHLAKERTSKSTDTTRFSDLFLTDVVHRCKVTLKINKEIAVDQVLPHYTKPDIILCFDKEKNEFVDPSPVLSQMPVGTIKYPPSSSNLEWIAIVLATQNQIIKDFENTYVGGFTKKINQLTKIGYTPIVVNVNTWNTTSDQRKKNFIEEIRNKFVK